MSDRCLMVISDANLIQRSTETSVPQYRGFVALFLRLLLFCGVVLSVSSPAGAQGLERWVYAPTNLLVEENVDRLEGLMREAAGLGFTHVLLSDSKFSRLHELDERYFRHVERVRRLADELNLNLVPAVFPVGYSNDLLAQNPNLAEGLPVRDALFEVQSGQGAAGGGSACFAAIAGRSKSLGFCGRIAAV